MEDVRARDARAIALAAQGFGVRAARGDDALGATIARLGVLQLDSVNVLCRAHYLPAFARIGAYDRAALDRAAWGDERRTLFEYWGHEASLLPIEMQPLFRWRMARASRGEGMWRHIARFAEERRAYVDEVLEAVRARGPLRASEIESGERRRGRWWTRSDAKIALELLFWTGRLTTSTRRHFERIYDIPERVLPARVLRAKTPSEPDAHRDLLAIASRALGIATEDDLRDYFRLSARDAKPRIAELVEAGVLRPARVEGWSKPAYLHRDAKPPRRATTAALVAPFDPIVWFRPRAERLFGFRYRIEIYTPAHARTHGYYVLPFLFGDTLAARVDLKAEREGRVLAVRSAHREPDAEMDVVAASLATELRRLASWLDLDRVVVARKGNLAPALRAAVTAA